MKLSNLAILLFSAIYPKTFKKIPCFLRYWSLKEMMQSNPKGKGMYKSILNSSNSEAPHFSPHAKLHTHLTSVQMLHVFFS